MQGRAACVAAAAAHRAYCQAEREARQRALRWRVLLKDLVSRPAGLRSSLDRHQRVPAQRGRLAARLVCVCVYTAVSWKRVWRWRGGQRVERTTTGWAACLCRGAERTLSSAMAGTGDSVQLVLQLSLRGNATREEALKTGTRN